MKAAKVKKTIREVPISEFKAKCLSLLSRVDKTKTPIRVTRRGKPIAEIVPISPRTEQRDLLGSMTGTIDFIGDVISPVIDLDDF